MTGPDHPGESATPGLAIPASPFAHDDGAAPIVLVDALTAFAAGDGSGRSVMTALARSRLLVPIVAVADSTQTSTSGPDLEKDSHLATVLVQGPQGERAMLAFSSSAAVALWRADARPAPVSAIGAAQTALAEGAETLLVDIAGPTPFAVAGGDLRALAGAIDLETARGLVSELADEIPGLVKVDLQLMGATADLMVTVEPTLSDSQYREMLDILSTRLRHSQPLAQIFAGGVRIRVVAPGEDSAE